MFSEEMRMALEVVAAERAAAFDPTKCVPDWMDRSRFFASGSNHAGEIRGFAAYGENVGVAAPEVGKAAEEALIALAGTGVKVFVDSGAFGEITFENGFPEVKEEITPEEWRERLGLYKRLAEKLGNQLYCVAPDKVAFQADTLARLEAYANEVAELIELGANVIVPVQKGELSMTEFREKAQDILLIGSDEVIWGVPMKKDATKLEELAEFATGLFLTARPSRVHLLGLGMGNPKRYAAAMSAVMLNSPWTQVFCDAVRITAMVGRGPGGKKPRKLTAATDKVVAEWKAANGEAAEMPVAEKKAAALKVVLAGELDERLAEMEAVGWFDGFDAETAKGLIKMDAAA